MVQTLVYTINTKTGLKTRTVVLQGDQCDMIRKQPSYSYGDGVCKYQTARLVTDKDRKSKWWSYASFDDLGNSDWLQ